MIATASMKRIRTEIAKCRLVCCYCHLDYTAEQMNYLHKSGSAKEKTSERPKKLTADNDHDCDMPTSAVKSSQPL